MTLAKELNIIDGRIFRKLIAKVFNLQYHPVEEVIG